MSHNIQQIIAFGIVVLAAWAVGRRLWGQISAFRSRPVRRKTAMKSQTIARRASTTPLIQVQLSPPARLKRPAAEPDPDDSRAER